MGLVLWVQSCLPSWDISRSYFYSLICSDSLPARGVFWQFIKINVSENKMVSLPFPTPTLRSRERWTGDDTGSLVRVQLRATVCSAHPILSYSGLDPRRVLLPVKEATVSSTNS